jgi:hypothetical protein
MTNQAISTADRSLLTRSNLNGKRAPGIYGELLMMGIGDLLVDSRQADAQVPMTLRVRVKDLLRGYRDRRPLLAEGSHIGDQSLDLAVFEGLSPGWHIARKIDRGATILDRLEHDVVGDRLHRCAIGKITRPRLECRRVFLRQHVF